MTPPDCTIMSNEAKASVSWADQAEEDMRMDGAGNADKAALSGNNVDLSESDDNEANLPSCSNSSSNNTSRFKTPRKLEEWHHMSAEQQEEYKKIRQEKHRRRRQMAKIQVKIAHLNVRQQIPPLASGEGSATCERPHAENGERTPKRAWTPSFSSAKPEAKRDKILSRRCA